MPVYPSSIDPSSRTLRFLTGQLTAKRQEIGTRWRRLSAARQGMLALVHLRCSDLREAVEALSTLAPSLAEAMRMIRAKAFVIIDGTLLPIDRIAAGTPYYSGKHKRHGMNAQVLTDPIGRLLWASPTQGTSAGLPPHARLRCAPHAAGVDQEGHHPLPQTLHRPRGLSRPHSHSRRRHSLSDLTSIGASRHIKAPADPSEYRFGAAAPRDGSAATTPPTPRSAASASGPWPPSRVGTSCGSSAAAPIGSPT